MATARLHSPKIVAGAEDRLDEDAQGLQLGAEIGHRPEMTATAASPDADRLP